MGTAATGKNLIQTGLSDVDYCSFDGADLRQIQLWWCGAYVCGLVGVEGGGTCVDWFGGVGARGVEMRVLCFLRVCIGMVVC